jgi:hypothetical protein
MDDAMSGMRATATESLLVRSEEMHGDEAIAGTGYGRVRGETDDWCRSLMSKNVLSAKASASRHAPAVATLNALHLHHD